MKSLLVGGRRKGCVSSRANQAYLTRGGFASNVFQTVIKAAASAASPRTRAAPQGRRPPAKLPSGAPRSLVPWIGLCEGCASSRLDHGLENSPGRLR